MGKTCLVYCLAIKSDVQRLTDLAHHRGWTVAQTLIEEPSTPPDSRIGAVAIRRMLAKGEVQTLLVPSLLMLGGSLDKIVESVSKWAKAKVVLIAEAEGIDTSTMEGAAWMAAVASLQGVQQAVRRQKARAGQLRAQAAGVKFGRPAIPEATMKNVRAALAAENGVRPTARKFGISPARVAIEKSAMAVD